MTFQKLVSEYLRDPEYLYLLLEPVFIFGIGIGTFVFLVAWLAKNSAARITALIIIAGSSLMIFPYLHLRKKAEPIPTPGAEKWMIGAQTERRVSNQWVYFTMAGIAVLCTFMGTSGKSGLLFSILTVVAGTATVLFSIWLHMHEARIFHPNLRTVKKKEHAAVRWANPEQASGMFANRRSWGAATSLEFGNTEQHPPVAAARTAPVETARG